MGVKCVEGTACPTPEATEVTFVPLLLGTVLPRASITACHIATPIPLYSSPSQPAVDAHVWVHPCLPLFPVPPQVGAARPTAQVSFSGLGWGERRVHTRNWITGFMPCAGVQAHLCFSSLPVLLSQESNHRYLGYATGELRDPTSMPQLLYCKMRRMNLFESLLQKVGVCMEAVRRSRS